MFLPKNFNEFNRSRWGWNLASVLAVIITSVVASFIYNLITF